MNFFRLTMQILSALIMVYFFLIMVRIILGWFPQSSQGTLRIKALVHRITDPYMNRFRGFSWLRFGMFDFSPVLGLAVLSFLLFVTQRLSVGGFPSIGELLIWVVQMVWGLVAFLATLMAIIMLIRLVTLYAVKGRPDWIHRLDAFLFPRVSRILGVFTGKTLSYPIALGVCAAGLLTIRFLIGWLLRDYLYPLLIQL